LSATRLDFAKGLIESRSHLFTRFCEAGTTGAKSVLKSELAIALSGSQQQGVFGLELSFFWDF
jgi:hypothetical protein